jgi:hypothetical protein
MRGVCAEAGLVVEFAEDGEIGFGRCRGELLLDAPRKPSDALVLLADLAQRGLGLLRRPSHLLDGHPWYPRGAPGTIPDADPDQDYERGD